MKKTLIASLIVLAGVAALAIMSPWSATRAQKVGADTPATGDSGRSLKQEMFDKLIALAKSAGPVRVIVGLKTEFYPEGNLTDLRVKEQRVSIKDAQSAFLGRYGTLRGSSSLKQFEYIPFLAFETSASDLEQMQNDPMITSLEEDIAEAPTLAQSTGIVGAPTAWTAGYTGTGWNVAILDTGVQNTHSFLTGKVVSEACYSTTGASPSTSVCPGGVAESTAANSGVNCATSISGCAHGTNVAGIAAGTSVSFSGVAKSANIIAIQVFSSFSMAANCGSTTPPCALSFTSDQIKGLERVRTLSNTMPIAAANMSLGAGNNTTNCDAAQPSRKAAIDNLRSVGVATVISSGNDGLTNAMGAPACISSAVSVGSTDDGSSGTTLNVVSSFSNSASYLHLLAPGRWINSSIPNNAFSNYSGTSMAAPHITGAFALMKQKMPAASVTKIQNTLIATGQPITDSRNGIIKPRLRIVEALAALTNSVPFDYDGDGKADVSVFRPGAAGVWFVQNSSNGSNSINQFGATGDVSVPADFDGDGKTDVAIFRPSSGIWYWLKSSDGQVGGNQFGASTDLPVPADYDGDGKADIAIFRPSTGTWWILRSATGLVSADVFGITNDRPTIGDYDGDGKADLAVFRPSSGVWYHLKSTNGAFSALTFGEASDKAVPADYDGDGKTDVAIYRPSTGGWYWVNSSNSAVNGNTFGVAEDLPVAGDYDGDGRADIAVFRPSQGIWYLLRTTAGLSGQQYGTAGDVPTPNSFVR